MKRVVLILTIFAGMILLAMSANADPRTLNYQGRLLDDSGDPVTDGVYTFDFHIFLQETGGSYYYAETGRQVTVTDGMFSVQIGKTAELAPSVFYNKDSLWLQVTVGGEILSPRTLLTASPYAKQAEDISGESVTSGCGIKTNSRLGEIRTYGADSLEQIRLWGNQYGELFLYDGSASNHLSAVLTSEAGVSAGSPGGGMYLFSDAGAAMGLNAGESGDESVQLFDDAINSQEMLNEPGLASETAPNFVYLSGGHTIYNLDSVTITAPSYGYVVVTGGCYVNSYHTTGTMSRYRLLVSSSVGYTEVQEGIAIWTTPSSQPSGNWQIPMTSSRTFIATQGTHTYYLNFEYEAGASGSSNVAYGYIRATYFPTLYGTLSRSMTTGINDGLPIDGSVPHADTRETITVEDHQRILDEALAAQRSGLEERVRMLESQIHQVSQQSTATE